MVNKDIIEGEIKDHPEGLSVQDLSYLTKLSRNTISIILAELRGKDKVKIRLVGRSKLYSWRGKNGTK